MRGLGYVFATAIASLFGTGSRVYQDPDVTLSIAMPRPDRAPRRLRRWRSGRVYPHSSDRQRARYARQLAAGQLNIGRA